MGHYLAADHRALRRPPGRVLLPKEGANDFAIALIDLDSLAAYEQYRERLAADPDAQANAAFVRQARCILAERRSFLRQV